MEFRILGAPEVIREGVPVAIRGRIAPRLLAVLALEAGHAVPMSTLVDALWEEPPATARRQVQNTVSALRALLGEATVAGVADGYRLAVAPDAVDAGRFAAGVRRARQSREEGDPAAALRQLREALGLWRGHPLAGMGGRVLEQGARRLDDARLAAFEDRYELELELGQRVSVGELRQLLSEHPYRQRLAALLMLALYREGRTPEALETYTAIRRRLAADLGTEPNPLLRGRYSAILREDAELDAPATRRAPMATAATTPVTGFAPAQLPAALAGFTGRLPQLRVMDALGGGATGLAAITGTGGSGKTALAVHWAHRNRHRFGDGQLYLNLRGFDSDAPLAPRDALVRLLTALGHPGDAVPVELDAAAALYRSLMAQRRILLLLDNARDVAQVKPLLPGGSGAVTLITSRHRLTELTAFHGAKPVTLGTLDAADARKLLATLVTTERLAADPEATDRLIALCAGLPLALRIVGANLSGRPYSTVAEFVAEHSGPDPLGLFTVDGDPNATVATVFEHSVKALGPAERDLFARLGLVPGEELPEDLCRAAAGLSEAENRELLGRLESAHLIERHRPRQFRFHDLVRLYARQRAESTLDTEATDATRAAVIDWYAANHHRLDGDPGDLIAAFRAWSDHPLAWRLARVLPEFVRYGHHLADLTTHVETGLRLAERRGDPESLSQMYDALAEMNVNSGDHLTALANGRKAVALARRLPEGDADGRLRSGLAALLLYNSYYEESARLSLESLAIARSRGNTPQLIHDHIFLGAARRSTGRFAEAEDCFNEAVRLADECEPGFPRRMTARFKLAKLYNDMDRFDLAWPQLEWIDKWWREHEPGFLRNRVLWLRATVRLRTGDYEGAERDLADSWELSTGTGVLTWARHARFTQIELCCRQRRYELAKTFVDELAEAGARDFERDDRGQWAVLSARVHLGLARYAEATADAELAAGLFAETNTPLRLARSLVVLTRAREGLGESRAAATAAAAARRGFAELGLDAEAHFAELAEGPNAPQTPPPSS